MNNKKHSEAESCCSCTESDDVKPSKLYKYKSIDNLDYVFDILHKRILYFSSTDQFNDPMEFNFALSFDKDLEDKKNFFNTNQEYKDNLKGEISEASITEFEQRYDNSYYLNPTKNKYGAFCFSSSHLDGSLWSYYGESHSGVCIELDVSNADDKKIARVLYKDELPVINFYEQKNFKEEETSKLFRTKHRNFINEKEYRCFGSPRECNKFEELGKNVGITKMYLGVNCRKHKNYYCFLKRLLELCPNLKVVPLRMCKTRYELIEGDEITVDELWKEFVRGITV